MSSSKGLIGTMQYNYLLLEQLIFMLIPAILLGISIKFNFLIIEYFIQVMVQNILIHILPTTIF